MNLKYFSSRNNNVDEWLRKEAEKIRADHSYATGLKKLAFEEFLENLRDKPELTQNLNNVLAKAQNIPTIDEWSEIIKKEHHPPCIITPHGGRWEECPHHKNSGGYHGWGFCIYRTDYDIMQNKERNCKFKNKTTDELPEELFEI